MANKERLGRGLESLLGEAIGIESSEKIMNLNVIDIQPNEAQPRKQFNQPQMETLSQSIQEHGILQPIIVRPTSKGYKIIAGERRWRASKATRPTKYTRNRQKHRRPEDHRAGIGRKYPERGFEPYRKKLLLLQN